MIVVVKILVKNIAKIGGHHVNWILKQNLKSSSPVWPNNFTAQQFDLKYEIWTIHAELMNYAFSVKGKKENTENLNVSQMRKQLTEEHVSANNLKKNMKSSPVETNWRKMWKAHQCKEPASPLLALTPTRASDNKRYQKNIDIVKKMTDVDVWSDQD